MKCDLGFPVVFSALMVAALATNLAACQGCSPKGEAPPSTKVQAPSPSEPTKLGGVLAVTAGSDFPFRVYKSSGGTEVAKGTCNIHRPALPVGVYRVVVSVEGNPDVTLGPATLEADKTTTLNLAGFGRLRVSAVKDLMHYKVKDTASVVVAEGDTNISVLGLPVGQYSIEVDAGDLPPASIDPVTVEDRKLAEPKVTGFGLVMVKAGRDFIDYTVVAKDGKVLAKGATNISTVLLPVGEYTVVAGETKVELVVKEGDKKNFPLGI
jgi:hypothetical protein